MDAAMEADLLHRTVTSLPVLLHLASSGARAYRRPATARSPRLLSISLRPSLCPCLVTEFFPARALSFLPASELPCAAGSETHRPVLPVPGACVIISHRRRSSLSVRAPTCKSHAAAALLLFLLPVEKRACLLCIERGRSNAR